MDSPPGPWVPPQTPIGTPVPPPQGTLLAVEQKRPVGAFPMGGGRSRENEQGKSREERETRVRTQRNGERQT